MKPTGFTMAQQRTPVIESDDDGDVLRPLRAVLAKYQRRAAYLQNFSAKRRALPKNRKVIPAIEEPALFYQQAAQAVNALIQQ